ncbi:MAG: Uma2 family endonuclease [Oscillochloridaceae bacterium umkhey_bin13]
MAAVLMAAPVRIDTSLRRFTVDEYSRMLAAGVLRPDERVELLDGAIVEMSPIGPLHAAIVSRLYEILLRRLPPTYQVRAQQPIRLSLHSEPEPDLAVVIGRVDYYATAHPTPADVRLVIEVADTTLTFDRGIKLALYATAALTEVWIVDVAGQQIEQYTDPDHGQYRSKQTYGHGQELVLPTTPSIVLSIDAMLG